MRRETQNTFDRIERNTVICGCFPDARDQHKSQMSASRFLVRAHGFNQPLPRHSRPRRQRRGRFTREPDRVEGCSTQKLSVTSDRIIERAPQISPSRPGVAVRAKNNEVWTKRKT